MERPPEDDCCAICHDKFSFPCQANCSHWFCGYCILSVWHHGSALQPCKCPICRRMITLLIPGEATGDQCNGTEVGQVMESISRYNRMFGGSSRNFIQILRDVPFFLRRLSREFMNPHRSLPVVFKARIIFAVVLSLIYVLSPVDFIPEGVFGVVGLLDDLLILLIVFLHLASLYRSILLYRHGTN